MAKYWLKIRKNYAEVNSHCIWKLLVYFHIACLLSESEQHTLQTCGADEQSCCEFTVEDEADYNSGLVAAVAESLT